MSNAKHTPGTWYEIDGFVKSDICGNVRFVAAVGNNGTEQTEANARMIAAAPELLAALEWAVRFIDTYAKKNSGPATPEINKCRAAIAKAKGGAQ